MSIFNLTERDSSFIGNVQAVDTASIVVKVENEDVLSNIQVNNLVIIQASKTRQTLIGMVNKIIRTFSDDVIDPDEELTSNSNDIVKVNMIGTLLDKEGLRENVFKRTLESVPEISSEVYIMNDENLSAFMNVISATSAEGTDPLNIGTYALNKHADAYLDGNRFFQKHAVIVGSTGSGKSCTVATIIQQIANLKSANAILFDMHGEYAPIEGDSIKHYRIAGPTDTYEDNILFLPYWLLTYEEMQAMLIDRGDQNAPNQAMLFSRTVLNEKKSFLSENEHSELIDNITIDSPVPFSISEVLSEFNRLNIEMVDGTKGKKQGDYYGKLSRFIQRLENKVNDKRLNFMFCKDESLLKYEYIDILFKKLMLSASNNGGIKIIDFSEVPSDILPLIVSLIARLVFSVQQWVEKENIQPIAIFCDEAHLYIPQNVKDGVETLSLNSFERIAKEGRKYGIGLVVITQRPSEVDRTVLSQSSNYVAMRLTNSDDQNVIKRLLPDSIGNFGDILPILDVGEALVVGDACLLPSRIIIKRPNPEPNSSTVKFWDEWAKDMTDDSIVSTAVKHMIKQSK
ncbi:MAG: ATP-binding protein [Ruminococcus sp.]|uniref:ATP-binding protein n=1 Tax=Ruminococcus sp. TaxID=41978 RepID=UPI002873D462|nr:ATP-binding protein [Ruminococcus sp.]MBQ3284286.1 ATP-binding protein [Ruminococcus sp.]